MVEIIETKGVPQKERRSNIELLRIFSAIGVILLHINNPKGINYAMTDGILGGGKFAYIKSFRVFGRSRSQYFYIDNRLFYV